MEGSVTLAALGLTEETLADRLVEKLEKAMLESLQYDEESGNWYGESVFAKRLSGRVAEQLNAVVDALAEKHILPRVVDMVETLALQETNKWGEKLGKPLTFVEYLTQRADVWLREEVNYEGKTKGQDAYSWRKSGTRVEYMIDKHLQYAISTAMTNALSAANKSIVEGLKDAVNTKLGEIKVQLDTKVVKA